MLDVIHSGHRFLPATVAGRLGCLEQGRIGESREVTEALERVWHVWIHIAVLCYWWIQGLVSTMLRIRFSRIPINPAIGHIMLIIVTHLAKFLG